VRSFCCATASSAYAIAPIAEPSAIYRWWLDDYPFIWRDFLPGIEKCGDREPIRLEPSSRNFNERGT
jgi:hypothetical protein